MGLSMLTLISKNNTVLLILAISSFSLTWYVVANNLPLRSLKLSHWYTPEYKKPDSNYFYADAWGQETSHAVLYHDIGPSIKNARQADIIFIGNSRMPLGLREEFIVPLAEQAGLRVFSLGVGHGESAEFARRVIRKHQLKPKILVVLGGPHAYGHRMSKLANKTVAIDRWTAITQQLQTRGSWWFRSKLHAWMPHITFPNTPREAQYIIYRSKTTGWWHPAVEPNRQYNVSYASSDKRYERILPYARKFMTEMSDQDTFMVATIAPYRKTEDAHLALLKQELGIPFINPKLDNITTADSSHLQRESAARLSAEFWRQFMELPGVRERLARP
ncbi:MAG: hypothetical protein ACI8XV_000034 [Arenicella sp.]|jgi:hypothetical protein